MRCLSLTQPWATLIAIGAKKCETRSWATAYRGPIAIHAAKGLGPGGMRAFRERCCSTPFKDALLPAVDLDNEAADCLPRGAIVAMCELIGCEPAAHYAHFHGISEQERAFGNFADGRYAWLLGNIRPLATSIPARGALGLWAPPPAVLAQIQAALEVTV